MIFTQMHLEAISGREDPLAIWPFSITNIGGSLGPMEIHIVTSYVIPTTLEDLGTDNAQVSTRSGPGIFSKELFKT